MRSLNVWTRRQFMALSYRTAHESLYDAVILLPTGRQHESGYGRLALIGVRMGQPVEIATEHSDDINWIFSPQLIRHASAMLRTELLFRSKTVCMWQRNAQLLVGAAASSIDIVVVPTN